MKIAVDAQTIGRNRGGDETYYRNLLKEFSTQNRGDDFHLFYTEVSALPFFQSLGARFHPHRMGFKSPFLRVPLSAPWRLFKEKIDLYHTQYVGVSWPAPKLVLTVHDLSFEIDPSAFPRNRATFLKGTRWSARWAEAVIAVSNNTKRDLVRFYQLPEDKIHVIYNGVGQEFYPRQAPAELSMIRQKFQLPESFLLSLGGRNPRKNMRRLLQAFDAVREQLGGATLVIAGFLDAEFQQMIQGRKDVLPLGFVPDEDLPLLYSAATIFIYPSLYEGFGLPVLEAMACGCPVMGSNTSSVPELIQDSGLTFDPTSTEDLARTLASLAKDPGLRKQLSGKGRDRAACFSWEKAARQTLEVYRSVLEGRPA